MPGVTTAHPGILWGEGHTMVDSGMGILWGEGHTMVDSGMGILMYGSSERR